MGEPGASAPPRRVAFDTDILIWYFRGHTKARRLLERTALARRAVPALVVMELIQGCQTRNEASQVKAFISANFSTVLYPDEHISRRAAGLLEDHAASHGLRVIDALIAATAVEGGCALATANVKHYRVVPRLDLVPFRP